jgi:DNA-binding PadR family transcriptional regulator
MYSVEEAIFLQNIYYWYLHNKRNNKNFYDNRYWTYNSVSAFSKEFVYLSEKQIRNIILKLETKGLIVTGNYNKISYDRTKWYSITEIGLEILENLGIHKEQEIKSKAISKKEKTNLPNENFHFTKQSNGITEKGLPIPSLNTDLKQIETQIEEEELQNSKEFCPPPDKLTSKGVYDLYIKQGKFNYRGNLFFTDRELETLKTKWNAEKLDENLDSLDNWLNKPKNWLQAKNHYLTVNRWINDSYKEALKGGYQYQVDLEWKANNNDNTDYTDFDLSKNMLVEDF